MKLLIASQQLFSSSNPTQKNIPKIPSPNEARMHFMEPSAAGYLVIASLASLAINIEGFYHYQTNGDDRVIGSIVPWVAIGFTNAQREAIRSRGVWLRIPCKIETENQNSLHTIAVRLTVKQRNRKQVTEYIPISGFPIRFKELEEKAREKWDAGD